MGLNFILLLLVYIACMTYDILKLVNEHEVQFELLGPLGLKVKRYSAVASSSSNHNRNGALFPRRAIHNAYDQLHQ